MNILQRSLHRLNKFQQRHSAAAFSYALIKKYGDDQAGYQAALITYYGFLSLFPLLIVLATVAGIIARSHPEFQQHLLHSATAYFPVIGNYLDSSIRGQHKTGLALVFSLLFTLYGARGVADAFRHALNHVWQVPHAERTGFPASVLRSLAIIVGGGIGFMLASGVAGVVTSGGHIWVLRFAGVLVDLLILFGVFILLIKLSLPQKIKARTIWVGALVAAFGITIIQNLGLFIVTHELKGLQGTYGSFAIVLGLLAYIYLQAQIVLYAIEIDTIRHFRLWPRSLVAEEPTRADKKQYARLAQKERVLPQDTERVKASFRS